MAIVTQINPVNPDLDAAYAFLSLLDPDAKIFHFQAYHDSKGNNSSLNIEGGLYEKSNDLLSYNASGHAIAVSVNEIRLGKARTKRNVSRIRATIIDDDTPRQKPRKSFPIPPSIIVESSPGKFHYYWLCDLPVSLFEPIEKGLVSRYGHDPQVVAMNSVLRLPGFMHQKGLPFLTRVVGCSNPYRYAAEEIQEAFPMLTDKPDSQHYVDDLGDYKRVKLKHAAQYPAKAIAWTFRPYKGNTKIIIRYAVQAGNGGTVHLNEYIEVNHIKKLKQFRVGKHTKLHEDLLVLGVADEYDLNHLPYTVMNEYFGRDMAVTSLLTTRQRDPKNKGKLIPRPPATQYSTIHGIYEARAK